MLCATINFTRNLHACMRCCLNHACCNLVSAIIAILAVEQLVPHGTACHHVHAGATAPTAVMLDASDAAVVVVKPLPSPATPDASPAVTDDARLVPVMKPVSSGRRELLRALVMDLSIAVHSIIIGITLGVNTDYNEVAVLLIALCFHQALEGISLGVAIALTTLDRVAKLLLVLLFCLTTPLGVAIGMGIESHYHEEAESGRLARGILNALVSGNLVYIALVEMIAEDFMAAKVQHNRALKTVMLLSLSVAAAGMAVIVLGESHSHSESAHEEH